MLLVIGSKRDHGLRLGGFQSVKIGQHDEEFNSSCPMRLISLGRDNASSRKFDFQGAPENPWNSFTPGNSAKSDA